MAAATELQYRSNVWTYALNTVITLGVSLASLGLVYGKVNSLGGWSSDDMLVVLGVFFSLGAIVNGVVHLSMAKLVADIRTGDFDYRLLRPVDAQMVAVAQAPDPWRVFDLIVGIALIAIGLARGGFDNAAGGPFGAIAAGIGLLAVGVALAAAFWTLLSCVTFWTIQGEGILWALDDMYDHLRWPITIFPPGLRIALSTVFPLGLAVTVPAQALTGRLDATMAASAVGIALMFVLASRKVWNIAVRRYEGASA